MTMALVAAVSGALKSLSIADARVSPPMNDPASGTTTPLLYRDRIFDKAAMAKNVRLKNGAASLFRRFARGEACEP
jgi:hypothetical protein